MLNALSKGGRSNPISIATSLLGSYSIAASTQYLQYCSIGSPYSVPTVLQYWEPLLGTYSITVLGAPTRYLQYYSIGSPYLVPTVLRYWRPGSPYSVPTVLGYWGDQEAPTRYLQYYSIGGPGSPYSVPTVLGGPGMVPTCSIGAGNWTGLDFDLIIFTLVDMNSEVIGNCWIACALLVQHRQMQS